MVIRKFLYLMDEHKFVTENLKNWKYSESLTKLSF